MHRNNYTKDEKVKDHQKCIDQYRIAIKNSNNIHVQMQYEQLLISECIRIFICDERNKDARFNDLRSLFNTLLNKENILHALSAIIEELPNNNMNEYRIKDALLRIIRERVICLSKGSHFKDYDLLQAINDYMKQLKKPLTYYNRCFLSVENISAYQKKKNVAFEFTEEDAPKDIKYVSSINQMHNIL